MRARRGSIRAPRRRAANRPGRVGSFRTALFFILTTAVPALAAEGFPALRVTDQIERYPITGSDIRHINLQLQANPDASGNTGHGSTRSEIELSTRLEPDAHGCRIARLEVHLDVTTRLPEWHPVRKPSRRTRQEWTQSAATLARHEDGHRAHAVEAAEDLRKTLIDLGPKKDCQRLDLAIAIELHSAVGRLDSRDRRYDARTNGGSRDDPLLDTSQSPGDASRTAASGHCRVRRSSPMLDSTRSGAMVPSPLPAPSGRCD